VHYDYSIACRSTLTSEATNAKLTIFLLSRFMSGDCDSILRKYQLLVGAAQWNASTHSLHSHRFVSLKLGRFDHSRQLFLEAADDIHPAKGSILLTRRIIF